MTIVASNYLRAENDLYQTEPWATEALLRHLSVGADWRVWDPAAGNHLIADMLRMHGATVFTSDIVQYDRLHDSQFDFLKPDYDGRAGKVDAIITNPPYGDRNRDVVRFCELALDRCEGWVAMLLTATFDLGKTRRHLFRDSRRFAGRVALIDRIRWFNGPGSTSGTADHAWFIGGPTTSSMNGAAQMLWEGRAT